MRGSLALVLVAFAARVAFAQVPDPSDAVEEALAAASDLAVASAQSGDPVIADAALRANEALANAADALKASPCYRPPAVMDPVTFKTFYDALSDGMSGDRQASIASAARGHLFTVDQLVLLMNLFAMGDERIRVALIVYPHLADSENFDRVYGALSFDSDRRKLALVIARKR
jgi:hypothetical protein